MAINPNLGFDTGNYGYWGSFYGPAWNKYMSQQGAEAKSGADTLQSYGDQFKSQFEQLVGRVPSDSEVSSFYNTVVAPTGSFNGGANPGQQELSDRTQDFIGRNYQRQAEDVANSKLMEQQDQANQLGELFRSQGNTAIDSYQTSLMDFAQKLFERVRPNLMTSLQAQGLLNSGGLNQALAGEQGDIARDAGEQVAQQRLANDQGANEIKFGGAYAPYQFKQQQALSMVPNLMAAGQSALQRAYQTRQGETDYFHSLQLMNYQNQMAQKNKPSFLQNLGNTVLSGFTPAGATEAYKNYGTGFNQIQQGNKAGA